MNAEKYQEIANAIIGEAKAQVEAKQPDYAQDPENAASDVLANFKIVGHLERYLRPHSGVRPDPAGFALFTYAMKHLIPWARAVLYGIPPRSEPLIGRAADLVNYIILGGALAVDRFEIDLYGRGAETTSGLEDGAVPPRAVDATPQHDPTTCILCFLHAAPEGGAV